MVAPSSHKLEPPGNPGRFSGLWGDLWCRSFATAEHALWLILNLWLFAQFIGTTLRFVEPGARIELREKFSANEVIPEDIRRRLLQAYFQGIPSILWPSEDKKSGPLMLFSHGVLSPDRSIPEVAVTLHRPSRLADVWLRPLAWALGRWRQRCIDQLTEKGVDRFGNISVPIYFETTLTQSFDLVLRCPSSEHSAQIAA